MTYGGDLYIKKKLSEISNTGKKVETQEFNKNYPADY